VSLDSKGDSFDQTSFDEVRVGLGWGAVTGNAEACGDLGTVQYYDLDENCYINLGGWDVPIRRASAVRMFLKDSVT
ncbi:MAG: hypothetical protein ACYTBW_04035, partial [Planctomycetota bacterium]